MISGLDAETRRSGLGFQVLSGLCRFMFLSDVDLRQVGPSESDVYLYIFFFGSSHRRCLVCLVVRPNGRMVVWSHRGLVTEAGGW